MCTYDTQTVPLQGCSGKLADGWARISTATVYFDHPVHAPADHTVNIDFLGSAPEASPLARLAVELSPGSARELANAILRAADLGDAQHGPS